MNGSLWNIGFGALKRSGSGTKGGRGGRGVGEGKKATRRGRCSRDRPTGWMGTGGSLLDAVEDFDDGPEKDQKRFLVNEGENWGGIARHEKRGR